MGWVLMLPCRVFFSALCSPGSSRPGGLCPAFCPAGFFFPPCAVLVVSALEACALQRFLFLPCGVCFLPCRGFFPALQGFSPALQGFLSCPAGFLSCPAEVSFLPCQGFLFHPAQAPCAGFSLCRVLLPPCAGFFSTRCRIPFHPVPDSFCTLCRIPFPPCAGFLFHPVPCAGFFFHPVQGSFSTLRRHPVQGFFPALLGFLFCPAGVSFLPCRGILSILRKVLVELQESLLDPTRVSFLRCVFPFHPQGVFFSALQVFFALQGFLFLPCRVSFLPCWGFFSALQRFLSCPAGVSFLPCRGFFSCPADFFLPCRDSFLPCRVFLRPYRGFFPALPLDLKLPGTLQAPGFSLCRVLLPPCAGFLFTGDDCAGFFATRRRIPFSPCGIPFPPCALCRVLFPPCAGFLVHPAQAPCAFSALGFLSCPAGVSFPS